MYLKHTMFLGYIVVQLFCVTCNVISPVKHVLYFNSSVFCSVCAVPYMAVFFAAP